MNLQNEIRILGFKCKDKISGLTGVVVSVSFDVSGCIQGLLKPEVDKDGKVPDGYWFDCKRLERISETPIVDQPDFVNIPGGQTLPVIPSMPQK